MPARRISPSVEHSRSRLQGAVSKLQSPGALAADPSALP
jgi:hypothetical protein